MSADLHCTHGIVIDDSFISDFVSLLDMPPIQKKEIRVVLEKFVRYQAARALKVAA